ncbi:glycosyltransferase family A protein [Pseudoalteromonas sp. APC 3213]|uniref:glycosyltransferase family 2 protein n=1 Tax=Pseudoalteromonas sp. APC 3213 TaxID=3035178 RepID=UPI0025B3F972|nr:glycosyltransferase family A protein [Pseudoalteromonas sp. APC 3213]MDN3401563.1 glycosyltransferase family A protein [Pseudoalteromonas sp. APC 3213]
MQLTNIKNVQISICTYRRPELLKKLLISIFEAMKPSIFKLSILIVDNDIDESAKPVISEFNNDEININYLAESSRNISVVRNACLAMGLETSADFILFLDDDEFIGTSYFVELEKSYLKYKPDIIIGPVITVYYPNTPRWVLASKIFERARHITGKKLSTGNTGNAFVSIELIKKVGLFDPEYGRSGGEDSNYFYRCKAFNAKFIWCNEAEAFEYLAVERANLKYATLRARRGGQTYIKIRADDMSLGNKLTLVLVKLISGLIGIGLGYIISLLTNKYYGTPLLIRSIARLGQVEGLIGKTVYMYGE